MSLSVSQVDAVVISGCNLRASRYNSAALICRARYGDPVGPLAMIRREPGQARKGAAAAVISCAGVWLAGLPPMAPSASSSIFVFLSSCLLRRYASRRFCHLSVDETQRYSVAKGASLY